MANYKVVNDTKGVFMTGSPHSQAVVCNNVIYCGGSLPIKSDGKLCTGSIGEKTRQCMQNLNAVLQNAGSDLSCVLKVMIFLVNMDDFAGVNEEYASWFPGSQRPARSCVAVKQLPRGCDVEIECVARTKQVNARL